MIPFVDLEAQYESIKEEMDAAILTAARRRKFILGPSVKEFEERFAEMTNMKHCVGCSNGTSAVTLALKALDIGPGDEIITVSHTFFATVEPILEEGATPVLIDVHEDTLLMNEELIEEHITENTKVIMPVHLYGQMCNMKRIREIADKHGLMVVEDSAQAHFATFDGKTCGNYGDIATYSFYPGKNLGAYGDAGAVTTDDEDLAQKMISLRNHGRMLGAKYEHDRIGANDRMDDIQGAVLNVKLNYILDWTKKRQEAAQRYDALLADKNCTPPTVHSEAKSVWHLYVIEVENRDEVLQTLKDAGVGAGIHYPIPVHKQPAFANHPIGKLSLPVTEKAAQRILSLPIFPEITQEQQEEVVKYL